MDGVCVGGGGMGLPQELELQVSDGCILESLLKASPLSLLRSLTVCVGECVRVGVPLPRVRSLCKRVES